MTTATKTKTVSEKKPATTRDELPLDLVGCCFAIWGEGGQIDYQSYIRSRPEPGLYLVQFFDWFIGEPSTMTIMPIEKMLRAPFKEPGSMILFEDNKRLQFWMEHRYREPRESDEE